MKVFRSARALLALFFAALGAAFAVSHLLERLKGVAFLPVHLLSHRITHRPPTAFPEPAWAAPAGIPWEYLGAVPFATLAVLLLVGARRVLPARERLAAYRSEVALFGLASLLFGGAALLYAGAGAVSLKVQATYPLGEALALLAAAALLVPDRFDLGGDAIRRIGVALLPALVVLPVAVGLDGARRIDALGRVDPDPFTALRRYEEAKPALPALPPGALEAGMDPADGAAQVEITEFVDLECRPCLQGLRHLLPLPPDLAGRVRVRLVHFPLGRACQPNLAGDPHPSACALAADWLARPPAEARRLLQARLRHPWQEAAELVPPSPPSAAARARLEEHLRFGRALGVESTPAVFVDGRRIEPFRDPGFFHAFLRLLLGRKAAASPVDAPFPVLLNDGADSARALYVADSFECVHSRRLEADLVRIARDEGWALYHLGAPLRSRENHEFTERVMIALAQAAEEDGPGRAAVWRDLQRNLRALFFATADLPLAERMRRAAVLTEKAGCSADRLRALYNGAENQKRYAARAAALAVLGVDATPVVWVRGRKITGPDSETLRRALRTP